MKRELFFSVVLFLFVTTLTSASAFAREISFRFRDFSGFAHWLIDDQRQNALYTVRLDGVEAQLDTKFVIKQPTVRAIDKRVVPGKTFLQVATFFFYDSDSIEKHCEPSDLFGSLSEGVPYTYAVLKDSLVFVESTAKPDEESAKDRFSKHYIISGMKTRVRFAGEFYVYKDTVQKLVHVVFDNGSGTYRPDSAMLPALLNVLRENFDDDKIKLHVKTFDQKIDVAKMFDLRDDYLSKK